MSKFTDKVRTETVAICEAAQQTASEFKAYVRRKDSEKDCLKLLTLRDFFAVSCLKFIVQSGTAETPDDMIRTAYYFADRMIAIRGENNASKT